MPKAKFRPSGASLIKRGALSLEEKDRIKQMFKKGASTEEIAQKLVRTEKQVEKYLRPEKRIQDEIPVLPVEAMENANDFVKELKSRTEWKFIKTQYSPQELDYFQEIYSKIRMQFNDNVQFTEDIQILTLCTCIINKHRHAKIRKSAEDEIFRLSQEINVLRLEGEEENRNRITALMQAKQLQENQSLQRTKELESLESQQNAIMKSLKSTREQRIKNIESSKQTFVGLIKLLQDQKVREKEGRHAELRRIAGEKAKKELSRPHQYMDGNIDQPFLTPEDIQIGEEDYEESPQLAIEDSSFDE